LAQLEQSREAQKKVKELDRFKTDIINVTSHELRTPLTILKGYAYVLRDRCESFNPIERMDFVQNIIDSCDRLDAILEQFLTISRFQRKEVQISRQIMQLKELFDDVRVSLNSEEGSRVLSHTEPEDIVISSDRSYLLMLLKNLVDNAIRYSASTSPVIIAAKAEETGVRISVKDFGVGISPTEVRNIFNPFDRIEEADKHQPGTGLGLYIVRLIADMLGTEIDVESQPNQGAEFSFRLPLFGTTPKMTEPQA
jgi:signal transduction histidine kinase